MTQEVKIPSERIGVIIGKHGKTRKILEKQLDVTLKVDSNEGIIIITNKENSLAEIKTMEIIKAISRGFSPERAMKLLEDDNIILDLIDISNDADNPQKLSRVRGRIIGRNGKSREQIENMTGTYISVYGKTIGIIGLPDQVNDAHTAIIMLINGSDHNIVFNFLDRRKKEAKMNMISYYY
ncbi:MAG TPA: KH domain-containing protein [Methanocorpusculum sp.]|nr:KH domain-containing protein [Methanocorpusculum sp.]